LKIRESEKLSRAVSSGRPDIERVKEMNKTTSVLHLEKALTPDGWRRDVRVTIDAGAISSIEIGAAAQAGDQRHTIGVPGVANVHSHAFQRAMAGLAERRGASADNFWSWRETMYRFALKMTPDQVEAVAAQAYVEMLEAGFTRVGEFHYLHHAPDGRAYDDVGEMAARIAAATEATQIGLTLLPVFYAHSDFGGAPPNDAQRRFICDLDLYGRLVDRARGLVRTLDGADVGSAPHSLRAVTPSELEAVVRLAGRGPLHIHIAEQIAEVEACLAWSGARPVEWLLDHADVGPRWSLIHATHMTAEETRRLAASGAVAGLCPITEANLGDGIFNAPDFVGRGGRFGIGTDSNVQISLADELRLLEYGQRLFHRARNVFGEPSGSTGRALFDGAQRGGELALGRASGLCAGADADIVTLRPDTIGPDDDDVLDAWIFSGGAWVDRVYARGHLIVCDGEHVARGAIRDRFRATMLQLLAK
jgi:formimidoylglutamate deiminase